MACATERTMWLVYRTSDGRTVGQPWQDLQEVGTLIDPDTGDDMPMIGWTTTNPADRQHAMGGSGEDHLRIIATGPVDDETPHVLHYAPATEPGSKALWLRVSAFIGFDNVPVVQLDTAAGLGRMRININDAAVWDADPEAGPPPPRT